MKLWTVGAIGASLVASLTSATLVEFNQNLLALNTHSKSSGISFNLVEPRALSATLQRREGMYGGSERIPCSFTDTNTTTGNSTIVIAISKCLNQSAIDIVHDWIEKVKADNLYYTDNGENKQLTFSTTLIPGECEALSESEDAGRERDEPDIDKDDITKPLDDVLLSDRTDYQSSKQVVPEEVARIQAFAQHGRVLGSLDDLGSDPAAAVVSFVNNEHSYDYIMTYEETHKISSMFNFKMCQEGESCEGHFENCIELQESIDLFMYNPFQITRSTQCGKLQGGIPVTYVDDKGKRQCFCTCPAGTKLKDDDTVDGVDECVEMETETCPCTWSTHPFGFKYENTENLEQCSFSNIATDWNLPVPFPSDNYVSDYRTNHQDDRTDFELESGPRIDVTITPINSDLYDNEVLASRYALAYPSQPMSDLPPDLEDMLSIIGQGEIGTLSSPTEPYGPPQCTHHTWKDYQLHSQEKIDAITITAYGKYEVSVDAYDYANNKRCIGCVAVVDKFRPKATTTCPTSFCDNTTSLCATGELAVAELTSDNVDKASSLVASFYDFGDKAVNDACSTERCDDETFAVHDFFTPESSVQSKPFTSGKSCFSSIEDDFKSSAKATTNPLKEDSGVACQTPLPVEKYQCMRCCEYSTQLREHWVDYSCGYDYDQRYCEGDPDQTCSFKQCLVLTGDMVVHASASIKQSIRNESVEVLKGLRGQGFQTHTQIHRALQCADFGANDSSCTYTASIDQLIEIDVTNKFGGNNNQYAFWRYKIDGDAAGWRLWEDMTPYTFVNAQTKITLEAWTACGRARKFFFYMHLHPHTDIKVCDVFKQMWYQTTKSRIEVPTHLCAYPGSDFAELTFDYQANIGLKHSRNNLKLHIAKLRCELAFQDRVSTEILSVQGESFDVLQRYAIELQTQATTSDFTEFTVTCTFSYQGPSGVTDEKTCPMTLTITDCNGPTIDIPRDDCSWDDCAGQDAPGPFEACGGHIVRATATATYMDTDDKACCETCHPLVCTPVLNLPDPSQDIKRCIPEGYEDEYEAAMYDNYNYDTGYYDQLGVLMATAVANHPSEVAATVLLAVCALVAIVALVVVQRRRAQAAKETVMMEDVYYPLLH